MSTNEIGDGYVRHHHGEHPAIDIIDPAAPAPAETQDQDPLEGVDTVIDREFDMVWHRGADGKFTPLSEDELRSVRASNGFGRVVDGVDVLWSKGADEVWRPERISKAAMVMNLFAPNGAGSVTGLGPASQSSENARPQTAPAGCAVVSGWAQEIRESMQAQSPLVAAMDPEIAQAAKRSYVEGTNAMSSSGAVISCNCKACQQQVCDVCQGASEGAVSDVVLDRSEYIDRSASTTQEGAGGASFMSEDEWLGRSPQPVKGRLDLIDLGNGIMVNPAFILAVEGGGLATSTGVRDGVTVLMSNGHQYRFDVPFSHPQAPYRHLQPHERADIAELTRRRILALLGSPGHYATELEMPPAELVSPAADSPFYTS